MSSFQTKNPKVELEAVISFLINQSSLKSECSFGTLLIIQVIACYSLRARVPSVSRM